MDSDPPPLGSVNVTDDAKLSVDDAPHPWSFSTFTSATPPGPIARGGPGSEMTDDAVVAVIAAAASGMLAVTMGAPIRIHGAEEVFVNAKRAAR